MRKIEFRLGQPVAFSQAVIRRSGDQILTAQARGVVVAVATRRGMGGPMVSVDWRGTYIPHEDGGTVRHIPGVNLTPILANGAVFGD
jgi:adenine/guanine phosphoribosyltransferase-like PRPP-binding protein